MVLADPDLPPGVDLPQLSPQPPFDLNADRYRWLREAYDALPRRSRVVMALRLPPLGHSPLTLREIGLWFGVGTERIRQLEQQALWALSRAWRPDGARGLSSHERAVELAPILGAALDRYPLTADEPAERAAGRVPSRTVSASVGARIAHERTRQGKTMRELAALAEVHATEISRIETGQREPKSRQRSGWLTRCGFPDRAARRPGPSGPLAGPSRAVRASGIGLQRAA